MTSSIDGLAGSSLYTQGTSRTAPKQAMDSEVFLQLLVTQLRSQDPSSPMDTNQMISQTTQLAQMEQITKLTSLGEENFSLQMRIAASGLVGKTVSYLDADGKPVTGTAASVEFSDSVPMVKVGDATVRLDSVSAISA